METLQQKERYFIFIVHFNSNTTLFARTRTCAS